MTQESRLNPEFPIKDGDDLSPPIVRSPIYECAEVVDVHGFIPGAKVRIYANLNELIGEDNPVFGFGTLHVNRPLKVGDSITATQTVEGFTSNHSIQPVVVKSCAALVGGVSRPEVGKDLYECGVIVPVGQLVPSAHVSVFADGALVGSRQPAGTWAAVWTQPLQTFQKVTAQQVVCECDPQTAVRSEESDGVEVKPAPNPVPSPVVDTSNLIIGNNTVALHNLLVGARVAVLDNGAAIGGGYATGGSNWCPIDPPIQPGSNITATQELCGVVSDPSDPAKPTDKLKAPVVLAPICEGTQFVVIRETVINATVMVRRNGSTIGYAGAVAGDLVLGLGGNVHLNAGDHITAIQNMGNTMSPTSNTVTVVGQLEQPSVEIEGGEPFFLAKPGEQAIDGPVFPRGRGGGPLVKIQACCSHDVRVQILDPHDDPVAEPPCLEVFPGYFTAQWGWQSHQNWVVPSGIPVGKYTVRVTTGCNQAEVRVPFYVIFDPADVGGPARFSFNETGIWFGTHTNSDRALLYHLHPSDARVFGIAIQAASGAVDPVHAAQEVCVAEDGLFAYSLNYHTDDVVDLIDNYNAAQCADDACCLTALLRSIGIPAHPVTVDAGVETGAAGWNFDTWTEFLAPVANKTEWLVLHPHQYPNSPAMSRQVFGSTMGVAMRAPNDIIVMANDDWIWSECGDSLTDVSYGRNNCQRPEQQLNKKAWVGELCEQGYWAQPHWYCGGAAAPSLGAPDGFRYEGPEPRYGGRFAGLIRVVNGGGQPIHGPFVVELLSNLPASPALDEEALDTVIVEADLEPGGELDLSFDLAIPANLRPGRELLIRARLGRRTLAVDAVRVVSSLESQLRLPRSLQMGQELEIGAVVRNVSDEPVQGVELELQLPYGIRAEGELKRGIEGVPPGGAEVFGWPAVAVAPMEVGTVRLAVRSRDGGPSTAAINVTVAGPRRFPPVVGPVGYEG